MTRAEQALQLGIHNSETHERELFFEGLVVRFYSDGSLNFSPKEGLWLSFSNEEEFAIFCKEV